MSSNLLSPPDTCFLGDYIGMESCVDLKNNEDIVYASNNDNDVYSQIRDKRDQKWEMRMNKKEFPPLISLLAGNDHQTNLHSHMPFVLKRQYTSDGRLILTEEKVKHHEYLQAHRSNGRLTLQLVHLDDDDDDYDDDDDDDEEEDNADEEAYVETEVDGDSGNDDDISVAEEIVHKQEEGFEGLSVKLESLSMENNGKSGGISNSGNGGPAKFLDYNSVRTSSSCFLGMPVPSIRPVHT